MTDVHPKRAFRAARMIAVLIAGAWGLSLLLGVAAAHLGRALYGCRGPEVGDPGQAACGAFDAVAGLALLAAFATPLVVLAVLACLAWATVTWLRRRRAA